MSLTSRGLGRGLDALFRDNDLASGMLQRQSEVSIVPLEALVPNPRQPRKNFAPDALEELAASIRSQGIVQPLLVRQVGIDSYEIVAGERRWRAAKLADLREIPVLVRQLTDMEAMAAALIENLQREDLNPLEEARALSFLREQFSLSQDELANTLGKSRSAIANALRLLNLNVDAQEALENGHISAGHARAVLGLESLEAQAELVLHCIQDALSVRDAEYAAKLWKEEGVFPWLKIAEEGHSTLIEMALQTAGQSDATERQTTQRRMKSPLLRTMQQRLRLELKIRASISGTETQGRISLSYQSQEELRGLLRRLGVDAMDPAGA